LRSMKESTVRDLILDRSVEVELHFTDTSWTPLLIDGKVDTGADRCSIDETLAKYLGWKVTGYRTVKSSLGREERDIVKGTVMIRGVKFLMSATVTDRSDLSHPLLVGHHVIKDLVLLEEEE